jgi:hypothetical protein
MLVSFLAAQGGIEPIIHCRDLGSRERLDGRAFEYVVADQQPPQLGSGSSDIA